MIQIVNFFADCLFIESWNILLLSTPSGNIDKSPARRSWDFFFMQMSVLLVRVLTK